MIVIAVMVAFFIVVSLSRSVDQHIIMGAFSDNDQLTFMLGVSG